jgi:outer membrane murein-binding lipoprotein Lpp
MDTETQNRFNQVEYLVEQLQKDIKRLDSRVDGANDWAFKAKTELAKKIDDLDVKVAKLSKDVAAAQKKK